MKGHNYLITLIVPVFNARAYVDRFLVHILKQSFDSYEVLFLDSCSTDGTTELIRKVQTTEERIKLIVEKDKGIYDAMNRGIKLAAGKWLYFMGCDDEFYNNNVLQTISNELTDDYDLVYGDVVWLPDGGLEKGECDPLTLFNRNINHQRIFYRKELFNQLDNYNLRYKVASDHELNVRLFCNSLVRKKYLSQTVANYHSGGFSANKVDEAFWDDWKKIFRENFALHLPKKLMYEKLGWYCRYLIDIRNYAKALPIFFDVLFHTFSPGFVKLTLEQYFKSRRIHAV